MITTFKYLSYILRTDIDTIDNIIANIDSYYSSWEKPKLNKDTDEPLLDKDGNVKTRPINSTKKPLKFIQKRIYRFFLKRVEIPSYFFGGVPKRDNAANAKYHQGNKYIFTTDLKSFFPSISNKAVFNMFLELGCHPAVSRKLTQLTTKNRQVPQGVPTSTLIANLVFKKTGDKLYHFARSNDIKFSIFVDDITMSSRNDFKDKIPRILSILTDDGYKISHQKTFYKTKNPIVTGVICQNNKIKLPHSFNKRVKRVAAKVAQNPQLQKKVDGIKLHIEKINSFNE